MPEQRMGLVYGFAAYFLWGLLPLYWKLLDDSGEIEILAHRILWSLMAIGALVVVRRRFGQIKALLREPRSRWALVAAAGLISVNWAAYIWGVNNGHVVETSLGYFINPLFTVLLGVVVLSERLRIPQWIALGIAFVAVVGLTVEYGRPPWIALALATSFGLYGLAKKQAGAGAVEGMAIETALLAPVALVAVLVIAGQGDTTATAHGPDYLALMLLAGPATAVPLLLFGAAATRITLTMVGLLQYIAPSIQFLLGVLVYHEAMPTMRWAGFGLVWLALVVLTWDGIAHRRRTLILARAAAAASAA